MPVFDLLARVDRQRPQEPASTPGLTLIQCLLGDSMQSGPQEFQIPWSVVVKDVVITLVA